MSLTVRHLNDDASFLLSFIPNLPVPSEDDSKHIYHVILDPWLRGTSDIIHPKVSSSTHVAQPVVASLTDLPQPNMVVISQGKSDHCHKETLIQLPRSDTKTEILAESSAANTIRQWQHFDAEDVITLKHWKKSKGVDIVHRVSLSPLSDGGSRGEVTFALLSKAFDPTGVHNAIIITYTAPTFNAQHVEVKDAHLTPYSTSFTGSHSNAKKGPTITVMYAPHGIGWKSIKAYVKSELQPLLPLTALLHCFNEVKNPWWMGGNICMGATVGAEIAEKLDARYWFSAHDGDKVTKGIATKKITTKKYEVREIEDEVSPWGKYFSGSGEGTRVMMLDAGSEHRIPVAVEALLLKMPNRHLDSDEDTYIDGVTPLVHHNNKQATSAGESSKPKPNSDRVRLLADNTKITKLLGEKKDFGGNRYQRMSSSDSDSDSLYDFEPPYIFDGERKRMERKESSRGRPHT